MSTWLVLRLIKFLALATLAAGVGLAAGQPRQAHRADAAFGLVAPALWTTWLAGYLLLKTTGRSLAEPFVGVALVASLVALHGSVLCAVRPVPRTVTRALGPAGLGIATAVMVTRDASGPVLVAAAVASLVAVAVVARRLPSAEAVADPDQVRRVRAWFVTVARLEGLSLVTMVLVAMPLRRATGFSVDGGTGALGWAHGGLVLIYLQALQVAARTLGWSAGRTATAFVASLVPFGTFVFEQRGLGPIDAT